MRGQSVKGDGMKLDKLKSLKSELVKELSQYSVKCAIYYEEQDQWRELEGGAVTGAVVQGLDRSKGEKVAYHTAGSLTARYYLRDYDAVVSLTFKKTPRSETRKKFRSIIEKIQEGASNAYRVSHHSLTHLLAKDAFREILRGLLIKTEGASLSSFEAQESELPKILAVMALDIDYFKQVNDTWGHLYGDQVLKIFGKRLESCASRIEDITSEATIYIGHPSGEEFLIVMVASATKDQFSMWANQFRACICDDVLPTDVEWQWLCKKDNLSALTPPPIPDRGVSTSIGVALHTSIIQKDTGEDVSAGLLDLADTALYRAKAAGRNQVIFYDEILSSCGRVVEHDFKTGVVAIDIGSNVGVSIGQEFKVYHPTFTGKKKFLVNDGRTTRTLGVYPRVESSRIVVFNTQPEISFAFVDVSENLKAELEVGSHLEAIPAGSIGHLLPNTSKYLPYGPESLKSADIHTLQEFVEKKSDDSEPPFAVVVRFTRETEYLRKYGTAALNKALARLYRGAQVSFASDNVVAVLDSGSICIVGVDESYSESVISEFAKEISMEFPALEVAVGIFCSVDIQEIQESEGVVLDPKGAIELARFSASEFARGKDSLTCHFSLTVAMKTLQELRKLQSYDVAYADFNRLIKLGVDSASIFNIGGLIAGNLGLDQKALEYHQEAINKDSSKIIYKSNYATVALKIGEVELGLKMLSGFTDVALQQLEKIHAYGYFAYAILLARAKLTGSHFFDEDKFSRIAPRAIDLSVAKQLPYAVNEIKMALIASI